MPPRTIVHTQKTNEERERERDTRYLIRNPTHAWRTTFLVCSHTISLSPHTQKPTTKKVAVTYQYLNKALHEGDVVLLDDGRISLIVTHGTAVITNKSLLARKKVAHTIRKRILYAGKPFKEKEPYCLKVLELLLRLAILRALDHWKILF